MHTYLKFKYILFISSRIRILRKNCRILIPGLMRMHNVAIDPDILDGSGSFFTKKLDPDSIPIHRQLSICPVITDMPAHMMVYNVAIDPDRIFCSDTDPFLPKGRIRDLFCFFFKTPSTGFFCFKGSDTNLCFT